MTSPSDFAYRFVATSMIAQNSFVRILVADDNELVRRGLCSLLRERPVWQVCGEAINGKDAVEKASLLKPDVMLVDISMPDLNGFEVASRIHQQLPECKILIVTEHDASSLAHIEPQPGVCGYVTKSRVSAALARAVEAACKQGPPSLSASA